MKVLHTIPSLDPLKGGPSTCTFDLLLAINQQKKSYVDLVTLQTNDLETKPFNNEDASWMTSLSNDSILPFGYSNNIKQYLSNTSYDLYHTNGLWMYCNHITCKHARQTHNPYIITTHGMLYPNALKRSYWKKWPLLKLWFNADILKATCIHATCLQEMEYIRQFGYTGPIAVIPNPIPVYDRADSLFQDKECQAARNQLFRRFGFIGRLHPIKRVENILYGASQLADKSSFEIIIIGDGDRHYEQFLKEEAQKLSLKNIKFLGFKMGDEKYRLLSSLSALILPSETENFGMVIPEALSVGTPVLASLGTPWNELNSSNCGWWQDCSPNNIASVMSDILKMSNDSLLEMGRNGRQLVGTKYAADRIASQMLSLYDWIINKGVKPGFIYE